MNEYIAYCGLDCEPCEKVGAIIGNNPGARERLERTKDTERTIGGYE